MNNLAEVFLWGTKIGTLYLAENRSYASFEYDRPFVEMTAGTKIELSPLMMPIRQFVYEFPDLPLSFHGVPGLIADSLPDKFGNAIISRWLADRGQSEASFNVIDRLCYTGNRGMGALEYVPATGPDATESEEIQVSEMVRFASDILNQRRSIHMEDRGLTYAGLLKLGTSAGGARAKALVAWNEKTGEIRSGQIEAGDGFSYWLIKFDGVSKNGDHDMEDEPEYTKIEYAYYKMAVDAGVEMEECRLFSENARNHFMTRRFDRAQNGKLHMQTLGALVHIDYNEPGLCSYEQASVYMRRIGIGMNEVEQLFRRMVFNVLAVNQDDHVKNISFLMDRNGMWHLSPAYDVTFAYNPDNYWLKSHQMLINGKSSDISKEDLFQAGKSMGLSASRISRGISSVEKTVCNWCSYAEEVGIRERTYLEIDRQIRSNLAPG